MDASQAREEGDLFPFVLEPPGTPLQENTIACPKRSVTPRGPLFPNLDEAHRKITSRLALNNPFRKPSGESQSSTDIPLQELPSHTLTNRHDAAKGPGPLRRHVSDCSSPYSTRSMAGRSLTDRQSIAKSSNTAADNCNHTSTPAENRRHLDQSHHRQHPDNTSSTLSRLVEHYATNSSNCLSSNIGSSELAYTFEPLDRAYGAATRLGFQGEENRISQWQTTQYHRMSSRHLENRLSQITNDTALASEASELQSSSQIESNWFKALDLSQCRVSITAQPSPSPRLCRINNIQSIDVDRVQENESSSHVKNEPVRSLVPAPLRVLSNRDGEKAILLPANPFSSEVGSSLGSGLADASTDSNDDPFKYDNEEYRRIRQLGKEREVSCALRRLAPSDTHASGIVGSTTTSPRKTRAFHDYQEDMGEVSAQEHNENYRPEGSFFNPIAFRALHGDVAYDQNQDIKVKIRKSSKPDSRRSSRRSSTFGLSVERHHRDLNISPYDHVIEGDWVTEATSEVGFGGTAHNDPFSQGIKATGSSIADYSDNGYAAHCYSFGSREKILQHSSEGPNSYEMHDLQGTKQVDLLPRRQFPRFNGFGKNNSRYNSNIPRPTDPQGIMSNPFRRDYARADASSYFAYKADVNTRSKYEFRDSTSTYTPHIVNNNNGASGAQEAPPYTSMCSINTAELPEDKADPSLVFTNRLPEGNVRQVHKHHRGQSRQLALLRIPKNSYRDFATVAQEEDHPTPLTGSDLGEGPTSSSSKFSFRLLDLSEAQALQRIRRASEDTNKTASTQKYNRTFSESSSRPPLTPLPRPSTAYMGRDSHVKRGSRLSSTFTPPTWHDQEEMDGK